MIHLVQCVRACDSSGCLSFGQINCISCEQWVSCHCGKVWDISDDLNSCKKTYTDYMERGFHQNATAYFFLRLSAWQYKRRRGTVVGSKVTPEGINFFQVKVKVDLAPFVFLQYAACDQVLSAETCNTSWKYILRKKWGVFVYCLPRDLRKS